MLMSSSMGVDPDSSVSPTSRVPESKTVDTDALHEDRVDYDLIQHLSGRENQEKLFPKQHEVVGVIDPVATVAWH